MPLPDPQAIAPAVLERILASLDAIEAREDVRILLAVESGSRAWGFPSPDSDYDVRFIYLHRRDWYLAIEPGRDVIEMPAEDVLDISGWDLKKALQLLIKPNPVLLEWLDSPIRYREDEAATAAMKALAVRTRYHVPASYHYRRLGEGQWRRHIDGRAQVSLKKYFYALRPTLALRWLRLVPGQRPPMDLPGLLAGLDLTAEVRDCIDALLVRKRVTNELGDGPRMPALDALIESELQRPDPVVAPTTPTRQDLVDEANALFRRLVNA